MLPLSWVSINPQTRRPDALQSAYGREFIYLIYDMVIIICMVNLCQRHAQQGENISSELELMDKSVIVMLAVEGKADATGQHQFMGEIAQKSVW